MLGIEDIGAAELEVVLEEINYQSARSGDECVDNCRAYRVFDNFNKAKFDKAVRMGCCGEGHGNVIINGDKWIVGWNYGH